MDSVVWKLPWNRFLRSLHLVIAGTVPIIRSPRGNAAEMVAEKLDKKLRENLRDTRNSLFLMDAASQGGGHFSFQRPLLIVLDRNVDMATPLHHTWTYQVLELLFYCIVLMGWSLLPNALRPFKIYCASPNLAITRTWICRLNFAQRPIFSGSRFFNEPEMSRLGPPA